jgi:hypothetical protein
MPSFNRKDETGWKMFLIVRERTPMGIFGDSYQQQSLMRHDNRLTNRAPGSWIYRN